MKEHSNLGVTSYIAIDQSVSFIPHINNAFYKATKVLNFIKCNLYKCSQYTKSNAYLSLVQSSLEYASLSIAILDPYYSYKTPLNYIEEVQRRAACLLDTDYHSSVSAMLQDLDYRRQTASYIARLSCMHALFYKSLHNSIASGNTISVSTGIPNTESSIQTTHSYTINYPTFIIICQN